MWVSWPSWGHRCVTSPIAELQVKNFDRLISARVACGVVTLLGHRCGAPVPLGIVVLISADMLESYLSALCSWRGCSRQPPILYTRLCCLQTRYLLSADRIGASWPGARGRVACSMYILMGLVRWSPVVSQVGLVAHLLVKGAGSHMFFCFFNLLCKKIFNLVCKNFFIILYRFYHVVI
jgi:hypothetical protein